MNGDSRPGSYASIAINRLSELLPELDRTLTYLSEFVSACTAGEVGVGDLSRDDAVDVEIDAEHLHRTMMLARGYFANLPIGPDADALLIEIGEFRDSVKNYIAAFFEQVDKAGTQPAKSIGNQPECNMMLGHLLAVEDIYFRLLSMYEDVRTSIEPNQSCGDEPQAMNARDERIKAQGGEAGEVPPRLTVDLARSTATLDGAAHDIKSGQSLRWLKVLADHPGDWITGSDLQTYDADLDGVRTDKLRQYLPSEIATLVESIPGKGSRFNPGATSVTRP